VDFGFSPGERDFVGGVRRIIAAQRALPDAADVMAPEREADSMPADSPARRGVGLALR
jgi:hypothetical protein